MTLRYTHESVDAYGFRHSRPSRKRNINACREYQDLDQLDWTAIAATDFRSTEVKERKQAEFLVHGRVPFELVERIGVYSPAVQTQSATALADTGYKTPIEIRQRWYF